MSVCGVFSSIMIGKLGDEKSRKIALLLPFIGLILADLTLLLQAYFEYLSPYWFILSELIFGGFGGYMTIFSSAFAYASELKSRNSEERSNSMAYLEGTIGFGCTVGLLLTSFSKEVGYFNTYLFFTVCHVLCIIYLFLLSDLKPIKRGENVREPVSGRALIAKKFMSWTVLMEERNRSTKVIVLLISFGLSYFAYIGTMHIGFLYLKQRFHWDRKLYGLLNAPLQASTTLAALFLYPFLKSKKLPDTSLALIGLTSRGLGKLWLSIAWDTSSVFFLILFDMLSRFAPSALRSLLSKSVCSNEQGQMFALVGVIEAIGNLLSSAVFHTLFPFSISFFPQLSFVIMTVLIAIPIGLIWATQAKLESRTDSDEKEEAVHANFKDSERPILIREIEEPKKPQDA
uniref:MFS domain-containing protein n=1 Tax=Steinernema glaseri TaxID=37863 RepID=A0A1I7ZFY3_9BILA